MDCLHFSSSLFCTSVPSSLEADEPYSVHLPVLREGRLRRGQDAVFGWHVALLGLDRSVGSHPALLFLVGWETEDDSKQWGTGLVRRGLLMLVPACCSVPSTC